MGIVLLDTMVVGGMFAVSKKNNVANETSWSKSIQMLAQRSGEASPQFIVPTSVCYELMTMSKAWSNFVLQNSNGAFLYANFGISNEILKIAAEYSYTSWIKFSDNDSYKVKSFDPITAAYSLRFKYPIITENQKDFCESYFKTLAVEPVVLNSKNAKYRRLLSFLSPRP